MTPQQYTSRLVIRILSENPKGLSIRELLGAMLTRSERDMKPLYLGPGLTLRSFINYLAARRCVRVSSGTGGTRIKPLRALQQWNRRHRLLSTADESATAHKVI